VKSVGRRALFLDRDGVINVEKNYVYRVRDFEFMDGIFELCHAAVTYDYALIIVTNQAGIARGYYTEEDFKRLMLWVTDQFKKRNIHISGLYFCPHHPTAGMGEYRTECINRKPNPGMIISAQKDLGLDLKHSVIIGDKMTDIESACRAGVGTRILLRHDKGIRQADDVMIVSSLGMARRRIFGNKQQRTGKEY
jgi:D-glycero-D-manno-heptose 1,7-bisphosphate phosphatase